MAASDRHQDIDVHDCNLGGTELVEHIIDRVSSIRQDYIRSESARHESAGHKYPNADEPSPEVIAAVRSLKPEHFAHPAIYGPLLRVVKLQGVRADSKGAKTMIHAATSGFKVISDEQNITQAVKVEPDSSRADKRDHRAKKSDSFDNSPLTPWFDHLPLNDLKANIERIRPGDCIGAWKLERTSAWNIDFADPNYASTLTGPASNKHYRLAVAFRAGYTFWTGIIMSKQEQGFAALKPWEYDQFVPLFTKGRPYELPHGASTALFTENSQECSGSMLSLNLYPVDAREWITLSDERLTPESLVAYHDLILKNRHKVAHIGQLLEANDITPAQAQIFRSQRKELTGTELQKDRDLDSAYAAFLRPDNSSRDPADADRKRRLDSTIGRRVFSYEYPSKSSANFAAGRVGDSQPQLSRKRSNWSVGGRDQEIARARSPFSAYDQEQPRKKQRGRMGYDPAKPTTYLPRNVFAGDVSMPNLLVSKPGPYRAIQDRDWDISTVDARSERRRRSPGASSRTSGLTVQQPEDKFLRDTRKALEKGQLHKSTQRRR